MKRNEQTEKKNVLKFIEEVDLKYRDVRIVWIKILILILSVLNHFLQKMKLIPVQLSDDNYLSHFLNGAGECIQHFLAIILI